MSPVTGSWIDQVAAIWGRRKWLAVLCFLFPCAIALGIVTFLPGIYRSTATVLVDRQQVPEAFVRPTVTSGLETRLQTIAQEIFSRARLDRVIKQFRLYDDLKTRVSSEEVIERMRRDIQVEYRGERGGKGTIAFAVGFQGRDPVVVAQVANTLASFFVEENLKVREKQATGTSEFLKVQLVDVKARLDSQEKQVSEFKRKYLGELPQQLDMNLGIVDRLDAQLRLNLDNQTRLSERRESLAKRAGMAGVLVPGVRRDGTPVGRLDSAADELARMYQELRQLRARYSEKYPDVVRLKAAIANLEEQIANGETSVPQAKTARPFIDQDSDSEGKPKESPAATAYSAQVRLAQEEIDAELRALKSEERRLRGSIATYVGRVRNAPKLEQEYKEVSRDYESTRELYATLSKRYEEAQLAESMEQRQKGEQFRILDPAIPGQDPIAPQRGRLAVLAVILSAALSVGIVVATERIRPAFHSVEALRAFTRVPVLLSVPAIMSSVDLARRQRRARVAVACAAVGLIVAVALSYFVAHGNEYLVSLMVRGRS